MSVMTQTAQHTPGVARTIRRHRKRTKQPANTIEISWHIDDVKEVRRYLTDDQAREVLDHAKHCHDASIGINWDVLAIHADHLFPRKQ
jgi:hypothetical protein